MQTSETSLSKAPASISHRRLLAFGLLTRRERWSLSRRGWLLLFALLAALLVIAHQSLFPFLAVTRPLRAPVLVMEGWIPVTTLHRAAAEFANGQYQRLLIARSLTEGEPGVFHGRSSAEYAVTVLARNGVSTNAITTIYFTGSQLDRTLHSAQEVKRWLDEHGSVTTSLDVVTLGPHARRSRLLYQRAFGGTATVGVISLADPAYDPRHWWRSSEGVREVLGESLAYFYARLLFWL